MARIRTDRDRAVQLASLLDSMHEQPPNPNPNSRQARIQAKIFNSDEEDLGSDDPSKVSARKRAANLIDGPEKGPRGSDTFDDATERNADPFSAKQDVHHAPTARGPYPSTSYYHHMPYPGLLDIRNYVDEHYADYEDDAKMNYPTPQFDESDDPAYVKEREDYKNRKHELKPAEQQGPAPPATPEQMGYDNYAEISPSDSLLAVLKARKSRRG